MRFKLFSQRQKELEQAGQPDVYQYDVLPKVFRVQVVHIWNFINKSIKQETSPEWKSGLDRVWDSINNQMAKELGLLNLNMISNTYASFADFFLQTDDINALDMIDISFSILGRFFELITTKTGYKIKTIYPESLDDLNYRFRNNGIGYEFINGEIIKINQEFIHSEIVKPAIQLLSTQKFTGALDEFMKAHEHYRHQRYKEAIVDANKSFESTMKSIFDQRGWKYEQTDTANKLVRAVIDNQLIPSYLESYFTALQTTLNSGLPTLRNRKAGHGQGMDITDIPDHLAAYALHLAATNIVFLVQSHNALVSP